MTRYLPSILFAWLSLFVALAYVENYGYQSTTVERRGDWYAGYAEMLVERGVYQDCIPEADSTHCAAPLSYRAYRLPGYPVFLAGVMVVWPDHFLEVARLLQAVLIAHITFMTVQLAYRVYPHVGAVLLTGVLMTGARLLNYFVPILYTEILFTFVLLVFVYAWLAGRHKLAGGVWGVSLLIRTSLIFATPLLLLLIPRRKWLGFAVPLVVVLIPYTVRNYLVLDTFAPFGTNGGVNVFVGHNAVTYRTGRHPDTQLEAPESIAGLGEVAEDREFRRLGMVYIKAHWTALPLATARKLWAVMGLEGGLVLLVWGVVGLVAWRKR